MKMKQHEVKTTIRACRTGWPGVWDAIKAALSRRERFSVPREVTVSFKAGPGVIARIDQTETLLSSAPPAVEKEVNYDDNPLVNALCTNGEQHIYMVYSYGADWIDMECTECRDVKKNLKISL